MHNEINSIKGEIPSRDKFKSPGEETERRNSSIG